MNLNVLFPDPSRTPTAPPPSFLPPMGWVVGPVVALTLLVIAVAVLWWWHGRARRAA